MRLPSVMSTLRRVTVVTMLGFLGCSASGGSRVEHENVAIAVSPDGRSIAFSAADGDLYLLSLDSRRVSRLTETEVTESSPNFSPDGEAVIYTSARRDGKGSCIFSRTLDGKQVKQLTDAADASDSTPSFSPDGRKIAFTRAYQHRPYSMGGWTWDHYDVCVMGRDGTNLHRVTMHEYYQATRPCFIAGGKTLVFSASGDYPDNLTYLFSVPADGAQGPKLLTTPPPVKSDFASWGCEPSVSADGKSITFISDRNGPYQYDVLFATIGKPDARPLGLTVVSRYNQQPVFLPESKGILFLAGTESNASSRPIFSLWRVGLDGSEPVRIADSKLFTDPLHWSDAESTRPAVMPPKP